MTASIYNLINIIVTQYLEIVHPTSKMAAWWKHHLAPIIIWPWVVGLVYHSCFDIYYSNVVYGGCYSIAFEPDAGCKVAVATMFFLHIVLPVIVFCHAFPRMVRRMRKTHTSGKVHIDCFLKKIYLFYLGTLLR